MVSQNFFVQHAATYKFTSFKKYFNKLKKVKIQCNMERCVREFLYIYILQYFSYKDYLNTQNRELSI